MATLAGKQLVYTFQDTLGEGGRACTAVVSVTQSGNEPAVGVITINEPNNMTASEFSAFQTLQAGYDELVTALVAIGDDDFPPA